MSRNKTQVALLGESLLIEGLYLALSNSDHVHPVRVPAGSGGEDGQPAAAQRTDVLIFEFASPDSPELFRQFQHDRRPALVALCSSCDSVLVMSCTPKEVRGLDDILSLLDALVTAREE